MPREDVVSDEYDVVVIGTGAGGGTIANTLAPSGKRILVLERGNFLNRELENWDPGEVFVLNHVGLADHHVLRKNFYMKMDVEIAGVAHQAGTCRFGTDPATSVLDINCKAHELDNLYVTDTSFFPSIGAVNPALTAMANAIRVGEHISERIA